MINPPIQKKLNQSLIIMSNINAEVLDMDNSKAMAYGFHIFTITAKKKSA